MCSAVVLQVMEYCSVSHLSYPPSKHCGTVLCPEGNIGVWEAVFSPAVEQRGEEHRYCRFFGAKQSAAACVVCRCTNCQRKKRCTRRLQSTQRDPQVCNTLTKRIGRRYRTIVYLFSKNTVHHVCEATVSLLWIWHKLQNLAREDMIHKHPGSAHLYIYSCLHVLGALSWDH